MKEKNKLWMGYLLATLFIWLGVYGCCEENDCLSSDFPLLVNASGNAFNFSPDGGRIAGGMVTILEYPGLSSTTDEDGFFSFSGLPSGTAVTFEMTHPDYEPIQTGTFMLGNTDLTRVSFQAPDHFFYGVFAGLLMVEPEPDKCQIASTVTRVGLSLYDGVAHGEPGATVSIDPPLPSELGPVYFNEQTIPIYSLTETSDDGGIIYVNVPPGDYVVTAHKENMRFSQIYLKCRAGYLVNASPPKGLQAYE